jgi:hypothetical protein
MDKVAEFYARWFAKKPAQEYLAAEAASEELARGSPKRGNGLSVVNRWMARRAQFLVPPHL